MKALKQIGNFSGEGDVNRWIDRFEVAIWLDNEEEDEADHLVMRLEGPAYDTWRGLSSTEQSDAKAIKSALQRVFGKSI